MTSALDQFFRSDDFDKSYLSMVPDEILNEVNKYVEAKSILKKEIRIQLSTLEKILFVYMNVISFGLFSFFSNRALEKALMKDDLENAKLLLKSGASHQLSSKQIVKLANHDKKESLNLMFAQMFPEQGQLRGTIPQEKAEKAVQFADSLLAKEKQLLLLDVFLLYRPVKGWFDSSIIWYDCGNGVHQLSFRRIKYNSAIRSGEPEIIKIFIKHGLNATMPNDTMSTSAITPHPIFEYSNLTMVKFWIKNGIDRKILFYSENKCKEDSLLRFAIEDNKFDVVNYLLKNAAKEDLSLINQNLDCLSEAINSLNREVLKNKYFALFAEYGIDFD